MQVQTPYDQAIARKYPEQVAIVIARDTDGKFNPIALGWVMLTSHEPPMMAISIGHTCHSLDAIRQAREFVLCFPSVEMESETLLYGTKSGRDIDKLTAADAQTQPAVAVDGVLLTDAVANFECKLVAELETGDHVLFVGKVMAAHANKDAKVRRIYSMAEERLCGLRPAAKN